MVQSTELEIDSPVKDLAVDPVQENLGPEVDPPMHSIVLGDQKDEEDKNQKEIKGDLILSSSSPPKDVKPKFYEKVGRKNGTTNERIKWIVMYWLKNKRWPQDFSEWTCWYYHYHYIRKTGKYHEKTKQWRRETKAAKADNS